MRGRQFTCPDRTHLNLRTWPLPHFNIELLSSVHSAGDSLPHPAAQVVRLRDGVCAQEARPPIRRADQSWWDESWSYWMEANGSEPTVPRGQRLFSSKHSHFSWGDLSPCWGIHSEGHPPWLFSEERNHYHTENDDDFTAERNLECISDNAVVSRARTWRVKWWKEHDPGSSLSSSVHWLSELSYSVPSVTSSVK